MCFSERVSLSLSIVSILLSVSSVYFRLDRYEILPIVVYSIMEITQYFQYRVIDRCDNKWNTRLTHFTWILQWIQPLLWN